MSGSGGDLTGEFQAALRRVDGRAVGWLRGRGLDAWAFRAAGGFGAARVRAAGDGLWEPDAAGEAAVILPAWEDGVLVDLVARLEDGTALRRRGLADLLGPRAVAEAEDGEAPLMVYGDPAAWAAAWGQGLRAAFEAWRADAGWRPGRPPAPPFTPPAPPGVVVLEWPAVWRLLGHLGAVVTEDLDLGERLDKALKPPRLRRPKVLIAADAVEAA